MLGFISVNKPVGHTSNKVLGAIKGILRQNGLKIKVGHMGTLDPLANGVLVVAFGRACRLFNYFLEKEKTYITTFRFGQSSASLDNETEVDRFGKVPTREEVEEVLNKFRGEIMQAPPLYSAVRVDGTKAYYLARRNEEVNLEKRKVIIHEIELISVNGADFTFRVKCSSGTYIRSLCRDIALAVGTVAITTKITRTECGVFNENNSIPEEKLSLETIKENLFSISDALPWVGNFSVDDKQFKDIKDGKKLKVDLKSGFYFASNPQNDIILVKVQNGYARIEQNLQE